MTSPRLRLHHLALGVHDLEGMATFYREVVGLEETARHRDAEGGWRSVWFRLGEGTVLMMEKTDAAELPPATLSRSESVLRPPGFFLLALDTGTPSANAALCARLEVAGLIEESRTAHTRYFRDPEGNRLAVSGYPL